MDVWFFFSGSEWLGLSLSDQFFTEKGFGYTVYVLSKEFFFFDESSLRKALFGSDLTSQTWMTANETNHPVWAHWLAICIPEQITHHTAFMYIDGGGKSCWFQWTWLKYDQGITDSAPKTIGYVEMICLNSRTVTATLLTIPNEPISFTAEGKSRSEDAIIAYTWAHFLNHTDQPIWLLRLPMTKAVRFRMELIGSWFCVGFFRLSKRWMRFKNLLLLFQESLLSKILLLLVHLREARELHFHK